MVENRNKDRTTSSMMTVNKSVAEGLIALGVRPKQN